MPKVLLFCDGYKLCLFKLTTGIKFNLWMPPLMLLFVLLTVLNGKFGWSSV